jgi:hypothetical protein
LAPPLLFQSFYSTATRAVIVASIDLSLPFSSCLVVVCYDRFLTSVVGCFGIIFEDRLPTKGILLICCWHKNQHLVWHHLFYSEASIQLPLKLSLLRQSTCHAHYLLVWLSLATTSSWGASLVVLELFLRTTYQQKESSGFAADIKTSTLFGTASFIPKLLFDCHSSRRCCVNQLVAPIFFLFGCCWLQPVLVKRRRSFWKWISFQLTRQCIPH